MRVLSETWKLLKDTVLSFIARDGALQHLCGLLTHEAAKLRCDRVLGCVPSESESGDGNYDEQDRRNGCDGIEGDCGPTAECFVVDERKNGVLKKLPNFRKYSHRPPREIPGPRARVRRPKEPKLNSGMPWPFRNDGAGPAPIELSCEMERSNSVGGTVAHRIEAGVPQPLLCPPIASLTMRRFFCN
jgi:hypothetical protein